MVFRAILNEAIRLAKRRGMNIKITAENIRLKAYYRKFGFAFEPVSMEGRLNLFKGRDK